MRLFSTLHSLILSDPIGVKKNFALIIIAGILISCVIFFCVVNFIAVWGDRLNYFFKSFKNLIFHNWKTLLTIKFWIKHSQCCKILHVMAVGLKMSKTQWQMRGNLRNFLNNIQSMHIRERHQHLSFFSSSCSLWMASLKLHRNKSHKKICEDLLCHITM